MSGGLRKRRTGFFVQIPRETIRDKRVSFRARGVLAWLLDMPEGWDVKSEVIADQTTEGRDAVRTALKELAEFGYYRIERRQLRSGRFAMGTSISETPVPEWVEESREFGGKPVLCVEQTDGTFLVKHKDGSLTSDGFDPEPPPPGASMPAVDADADDEDGGTSGVPSAPKTGNQAPGFPAPGEPTSGGPVPGAPESGSPGPLEEKDQGEARGETSSPSPADAGQAGEPLREDVARVCQHLVDRMVANGCKPPTITKEWRDEARRLMDLDGRSEAQVHNMIEWCQADQFWRSNILSMPTLRKKYDQMRLRALADADAGAARGPRRTYSDRTWREQVAEAAAPPPVTEPEDLDAIFGPVAS